MGETLNRDSINWCETIVGIDASLFCSYSMCQAMTTCLYTKWDLNFESGNFKKCQNPTGFFEKMIMFCFQKVRPHCQVENFYMTDKRKLMLIILMIFWDTAPLCLQKRFFIIFVYYEKNLILPSVRKNLSDVIK